MTIVFYVIGVVVMWVLAWGSLTRRQRARAGLAVGRLLLLVAPGAWTTAIRASGLRPVPVARLGRYHPAEIVKSNVALDRGSDRAAHSTSTPE